MSLRPIVWVGLSLIAFAEQEITFDSNVRLVEVYATVFDGHGKFVNRLGRERFEILDNQAPVPIKTFETGGGGESPVTCAILLDTTGSMAADLPIVKNSIVRLIGELGERDQVGVFGFANVVTTLQDYTLDKKAGMNAVLRARSQGATALFDAVSQVARQLAARSGRKAMIVFTDGMDNASVLNAAAATVRAKKAGVPIYAVGQGAALKERKFMKLLGEIAQVTGGKSYEARTRGDVEQIFADISQDLQHTYMLTYTAPVEKDTQWRTIQVLVSGLKNYRVRAKEGYYLD
jgi:VWFA-related protein